MTDAMPIPVRQLLDAEGDRERADILLRCPDHLVVLYGSQMQDACRMALFAAGDMFLAVRTLALGAVRDGQGLRPQATEAMLEDYRAALAAFAAGGEGEPAAFPDRRSQAQGASGPMARPSAASAEGATSEGQRK